MVELFCKNSKLRLAVNFFYKKTLHKCSSVFQKRFSVVSKEKSKLSYLTLHNFIQFCKLSSFCRITQTLRYKIEIEQI